MRRRIVILPLLAALTGCSSVPQIPAEPAQAPAAPLAAASAPSVEESGKLEAARESVRAATEWLARGVDSWFGDKPFEEGGRVSNGRLGVRLKWREDEGFEPTLRFNARFDLPNVEERAFVFIGRDNEREVVADRPDAFSREERLLAESVRQDQSFFAGVGLNLAEAIELRAGVRRGYQVYAQARYRKQWLLSASDRVEFRETIFWTVVDGFGSTTTLSTEHAFTPTLALRWLNAATVSQETSGLAWSSSLGLFKVFGEERLLSAEVVMGGETGRDIHVSEYGLRTKWQQPVYKNWLIGEFILGHYWPRENLQTERGRTWAVGVGVLMRF